MRRAFSNEEALIRNFDWVLEKRDRDRGCARRDVPGAVGNAARWRVARLRWFLKAAGHGPGGPRGAWALPGGGAPVSVLDGRRIGRRMRRRRLGRAERSVGPGCQPGFAGGLVQGAVGDGPVGGLAPHHALREPSSGKNVASAKGIGQIGCKKVKGAGGGRPRRCGWGTPGPRGPRPSCSARPSQARVRSRRSAKAARGPRSRFTRSARVTAVKLAEKKASSARAMEVLSRQRTTAGRLLDCSVEHSASGNPFEQGERPCRPRYPRARGLKDRRPCCVRGAW